MQFNHQIGLITTKSPKCLLKRRLVAELGGDKVYRVKTLSSASRETGDELYMKLKL